MHSSYSSGRYGGWLNRGWARAVLIAVALAGLGTQAQGAPKPVIDHLQPINAQANAPAFTLRVFGTDFVSGMVVRLDGVDLSTTFISSTQLDASVLPGDISAEGVFDVIVHKDPPQPKNSNVVNFEVFPECLPPDCAGSGCDPEECLPIEDCSVSSTYAPQLGDLEMDVAGIPQPAVFQGGPEARVTVRNTSSTEHYRVRARAQVVCPTSGGTLACACENFDWLDRGLPCSDHSCSGEQGPPNTVEYPKQFAEVPSNCERIGDWVWCENDLAPGESWAPSGLSGQNRCCDCDKVRQMIVCGEVDVLERSDDGQTWEEVSDPAYDVVGESRSAAWLHPDVQNVELSCFEPLVSFCDFSAELWGRPRGTSCDTNAQFHFRTSSGGTGDLECSLDGGSFTDCSSPYDAPSLATGDHTFEVRDADANPDLSAAHEWTVAGSGCDEGTDFRLTKTIHGSNAVNLVSLPYLSPYQGPGGIAQLCGTLNLSYFATVTQNTTAGAVTFICGQLDPSDELIDRQGVDIREPGAGIRQGVLRGTYDPTGDISVSIEDDGAGPIGDNLFPVLYHADAQTPQDLCEQCGLSDQTEITRFDAATGFVHAHLCGQLAVWTLEQGEAVLIREQNGPLSCTQSLP